MENGYLYRMSKKILCSTSSVFAIFKGPADKLRPHFKILFQIWLNIKGLGLCPFLLKSMLWWLEKVGFQTEKR